MKLKPEDEKSALQARHLVKWEELLAEVYSLIHQEKRDSNAIAQLETHIRNFIKGELQTESSAQPEDKELSPVELLFKRNSWGYSRRKQFKTLINQYGVDAISALFYSMLSGRAANCIHVLCFQKGRHFAPLNEVVTHTPQQLKKLRNCGVGTVNEIQELLQQFSLSMSMSQSEIEDCFADSA